MITIKLTEEQAVLVCGVLIYNLDILTQNLQYPAGLLPDDIIDWAREIEESAEVLKLLTPPKKKER